MIKKTYNLWMVGKNSKNAHNFYIFFVVWQMSWPNILDALKTFGVVCNKLLPKWNSTAQNCGIDSSDPIHLLIMCEGWATHPIWVLSIPVRGVECVWSTRYAPWGVYDQGVSPQTQSSGGSNLIRLNSETLFFLMKEVFELKNEFGSFFYRLNKHL